jgi:hypothetical protein
MFQFHEIYFVVYMINNNMEQLGEYNSSDGESSSEDSYPEEDLNVAKQPSDSGSDSESDSEKKQNEHGQTGSRTREDLYNGEYALLRKLRSPFDSDLTCKFYGHDDNDKLLIGPAVIFSTGLTLAYGDVSELLYHIHLTDVLHYNRLSKWKRVGRNSLSLCIR